MKTHAYGFSNDSGDEILDCKTCKSVLKYIKMKKKMRITRACQRVKLCIALLDVGDVKAKVAWALLVEGTSLDDGT